MRVLIASVAASALLSPLAAAITIAPRSSSPRAIGLDIERRTIDPSQIPARDRARLAKRQQTVEQTLDNLDTLYFANLTLGTPAQNLQLHIDTGSSDLWVNTATSTLCTSRLTPCEGGTYDSGSSSTHKLINNEFNISYVDGSGALGDYVSDTLQFGGVTLQDFQFGVGQTSSSQQGVLGIGYVINEVQVNRAGLQPYPNLPQALVNAGNIKSNAYSLWLNDLDASTGTILFGGVNAAKYSGDLATIPVVKTYGDYFTLSVALTGFGLSGQGISSSSLPAGVLLDSGSTLTYLPNDIVTAIYDNVGAVYVANVGAAYAECSLASSSATLDFIFSGQTISVPYNELFLDAGTVNGRPLTFQNGALACLFGIAPTDGTTTVLGDTFLRSAYVVYDLANNEISLAQTIFNATANDVREIGTGPGAVPGASAVAQPVSDVAGATNAARLGGATATPTGALGNPTGSSDGTPSKATSSAFAGMVALFAMAFAAV